MTRLDPLDFPGDFFDSTDAPSRVDELVTLLSYEEMLRRVDNKLRGVKGDFLIVVGVRGIGKSCAVRYVERHAKRKEIPCLLFSDSDLPSADTMAGSEDQAFSAGYLLALRRQLDPFTAKYWGTPEEFKAKMARRKESGNNVPAILILDNMDRIFPEGRPGDEAARTSRQNRATQFFGYFDKYAKGLKENFLVIITGDPEWAAALANPNFNYTKYENRLELTSIGLEDFKKILNARLKHIPEIDNPTVSKYWTDEFLYCALVEADGITRNALLHLEDFNNVQVKPPFTRRDYEDRRGPQLYAGCRRRLEAVIDGSYGGLPLARAQRSLISHGVDLLRRTVDHHRQDIKGHQERFFELVNPIADVYFGRSQFQEFRPAWAASWTTGIGSFQKEKRTNGSRPVLHPDVQLMLNTWVKSTGLDVTLLLKAYISEPFTKWFTDISPQLKMIRSVALENHLATDEIDELDRLYGDLQLSMDKMSPIEIVGESAKMIRLLAQMFAKLWSFEPGLPTDAGVKTCKSCLRAICKDAGVVVAFDADLNYVDEVSTAFRENPQTTHFDDDQVRSVHDKAARTVANVMRLLASPTILRLIETP